MKRRGIGYRAYKRNRNPKVKNAACTVPGDCLLQKQNWEDRYDYADQVALEIFEPE